MDYIFFHHTMCESTCDTLPSLAANQGDNTVSVAQGGTAIPGSTKQLLPPDRVAVSFPSIHFDILQLEDFSPIFSRFGESCQSSFCFPAWRLFAHPYLFQSILSIFISVSYSLKTLHSSLVVPVTPASTLFCSFQLEDLIFHLKLRNSKIWYFRLPFHFLFRY